MQFDNSVNIPKFKVFLDELRRRYFLDELCLYLDNLSVHRSNAIKERCEELSIAIVFSPIASPELNPVEYAIGIAKLRIKKKRLQAIMK